MLRLLTILFFPRPRECVEHHFSTRFTKLDACLRRSDSHCQRRLSMLEVTTGQQWWVFRLSSVCKGWLRPLFALFHVDGLFFNGDVPSLKR